MRTGFEVIIRPDGKAKFHVFSPKSKSQELSLVTYAQDPMTGTAMVLMGKLY